MCNQKFTFYVFYFFCLNSSVNLNRFTSEYDPMECLGSGGYGWVYKARNKLLKRDYAVKIVCCEE